jgi:hypothetical protein
LPSYYELYLIVRDELHESILDPVAGFVAFLGIGHFFTPTGRYYWKVVLNNYKIFLMVCLGIWTDEAVEAYGLEETSLNLSVDGRAFLYKNEETTLTEHFEEKKSNKRKHILKGSNNEGIHASPMSPSSPSRRKLSAQVFGVSFSRSKLVNNGRSARLTSTHSRSESEKKNIREVLPAVISVLICSRVILFQIVPSLVLFATLSMTLASFPLFIFSDFLIETLPGLIIYGSVNREMATEKELQSFIALHPETKEVLSEEETIRVLSEEYSWRLFVRGIVLFWNESRLLQFIQSSLTLFFSFLLLIYSRELLVYLIVILAILFLFILTKSLVFLLYLGSSLDVKDSDFPNWLLRQKKTGNSVTTVTPVDAETGQAKQDKEGALNEVVLPTNPVVVVVEIEGTNQDFGQLIVEDGPNTNGNEDNNNNDTTLLDKDEMVQDAQVVSNDETPVSVVTVPLRLSVRRQSSMNLRRTRSYSEEEKESDLPSLDFDDMDFSDMDSSSVHSSHKEEIRKDSANSNSSGILSTVQASDKKKQLSSEGSSVILQAAVLENRSELEETSAAVITTSHLSKGKFSHNDDDDDVSDSEASESDDDDDDDYQENFGDFYFLNNNDEDLESGLSLK